MLARCHTQLSELVALVRQARMDMRARVLKLYTTGQRPELTLAHGHEFHLFLSQCAPNVSLLCSLLCF